MAIETFGVTADAVRRHWFPTHSAWSTNTSPTAVTVAEIIDGEAGRLAGALLGESISASSILDGTPEHAVCASVLRMMVARRALESMTGGNPELAKRLDGQIDAFFEGLSESGATFLGNDDLSSEESGPDGPHHHIEEYSLEVTTDTDDASPATMPLTKADLL